MKTLNYSIALVPAGSLFTCRPETKSKNKKRRQQKKVVPSDPPSHPLYLFPTRTPTTASGVCTGMPYGVPEFV